MTRYGTLEAEHRELAQSLPSTEKLVVLASTFPSDIAPRGIGVNYHYLVVPSGSVIRELRPDPKEIKVEEHSYFGTSAYEMHTFDFPKGSRLWCNERWVPIQRWGLPWPQ